ncbi:hypothetical protein TREES_T100002492 [Tupaia chinensis]|uniref:Uncharacterized protein n=1 Tax=Tupaia chinensis TaxID=246437 RepID=L9L9H7_TUPCH|nr:hypothetical protein TREES_T100002492 [Tupaia chinensis]
MWSETAAGASHTELLIGCYDSSAPAAFPAPDLIERPVLVAPAGTDAPAAAGLFTLDKAPAPLPVLLRPPLLCSEVLPCPAGEHLIAQHGLHSLPVTTQLLGTFQHDAHRIFRRVTRETSYAIFVCHPSIDGNLPYVTIMSKGGEQKYSPGSEGGCYHAQSDLPIRDSL